jgi:serine-type D-Ala-D-Ala carboxypeptidase (penicillin-binding protein 5/6)
MKREIEYADHIKAPLDECGITDNYGRTMKLIRNTRAGRLLLGICLFFFLIPVLPGENRSADGENTAGSRLLRIVSMEELGAPDVQAEAAVLLDYETGTLLYEKNGGRLIPPASLTKLMTMHLILREVDAGRLTLEQRFDVPPEAFWKNLPSGSSLMFLEPGQSPTVEDLLLGLAVSSGNDAAIAAAVLVSGSVEAFLTRMNLEAKGLGLPLLHFADTSGLDPRSCITARQFAEFCRFYIASNPDALSLFHAVEEFTYPRPENLPGIGSVKSITQRNRNSLLHTYEGLDGLKSGYIDESGYNVAVTVTKNGRRLIAVLLGGSGESHPDGRNRLAADGRKLLDFGFTAFTRVSPEHLRRPVVKVWKGKEDSVVCVPEQPVLLTVPEKYVGDIDYTVTTVRHLTAPVPAGKEAGMLDITLRGEDYVSIPLVTTAAVEAAGPIKRLFHSIGLGIDGLRGN